MESADFTHRRFDFFEKRRQDKVALVKHVLQLFHKHDWALNRRIVLWISNLALDDEGTPWKPHGC